MTRRHRRFALRDVKFAGIDVPDATVDVWEDESGRAQWSARIVTRHPLAVEAGELAGHTADGRMMTGQVVIGARQMGPGGRRETLVEFHGSGELQVAEPERS
ncbi:MAG TPA: hypothetical protein VM344_06350 [Vitreimonas sp.]|nr:hypothetical protein [Vitreimonas sp.]